MSVKYAYGYIRVSSADQNEARQVIAMREARDATLKMPTLIIPSLQVNMKAGELPSEDESGKRFLKVPLGAL